MTPRDPETVLAEMAGYLAFQATTALYEEQPELWDLGERGRAHTLNDFRLHFEALAGGAEAFRRHAAWSYELFSERNLPLRWLGDAWRVMGDTIRSHVPEAARQFALEALAGAEHRDE